MTPGFETRRPFALDEVAGGVVAVLIALGAFPLTVVIVSAAVSDIYGALVEETALPEEAEVPPVPVVEARFVRFGAPPDPRRMPDRYVPSAATAPPPSATDVVGEVPADAVPGAEPLPTDGTGLRAPTDAQPALTAEQRAAQAREDLLNRLGDSAAATAEFAEPRVREGDAEGIAEGTAERGEADIYPGRLYTYFRRGWDVPTSIPDEELRTLRCRVRVDITADGRVGSAQLAGSSGNAEFDASVRQRLSQAVGAALPPPPPDEAERYLGSAVTITFTPPRRN
jgi:TonB family protein